MVKSNRRGGVKTYIGFVPVYESQMDWNKIRLAKVRCRVRCLEFDNVSGACGLALIPDMGCAYFTSCEFSGGVEELDGKSQAVLIPQWLKEFEEEADYGKEEGT